MNAETRFFNKVLFDEPTGCWNWIGAKKKGARALPYGFFDSTLAHRWSFRRFVKEVPTGLCVLHKCDNASCVNPQHLFLGTNKDNTQDMHRKGRWPCKLSADDVTWIKLAVNDGVSLKALALLYDVHPSVIWHTKNGDINACRAVS